MFASRYSRTMSITCTQGRKGVESWDVVFSQPEESLPTSLDLTPVFASTKPVIAERAFCGDARRAGLNAGLEAGMTLLQPGCPR